MMFCIECGRQNPAGAKFCAYCGNRLYTGAEEAPAAGAPCAEPPAPAEEMPAVDAPDREMVAAEGEQPLQTPPGQSTPARSERSMPPVFGRTVQPLGENPANPVQMQRPAQPPAPQAAEPVDVSEEDKAFVWRPQGGPEKPLDELWDAEEQERDEEEWEEERRPGFLQSLLRGFSTQDEELDEPFADEPLPRKKDRLGLGRLALLGKKEPDMVLTADGEQELPARAPVVRSRRDTRVPRRDTRAAQIEDFDEEEEESRLFFRRTRRKPDVGLDDAYVNRSVRRILLGIAAAVCLIAGIWLFATKDGSVLLAGFNLSNDAQAYVWLGDKALASNQIKRAAEAYYRALTIDQDNYEVALLVGKTQQQIGEYEKAANAYYLCTTLSPGEKAPYEHLIALFTMQSEPERASYFADLMAQNTQ